LIVIDTLARSFGGGDENKAQEMGEYINGLEWLKTKAPATMMVLHHTGKKAEDEERGSSALRAASDTMIQVSKSHNNIVTVKNNKQKDDEEFAAIRFQLKQVPVEDDTSCVLEPLGERQEEPGSLSAPLKKTLTALADGPEEQTTARWEEMSKLKE